MNNLTPEQIEKLNKGDAVAYKIYSSLGFNDGLFLMVMDIQFGFELEIGLLMLQRMKIIKKIQLN
jgi:hypothetical protein